MASQEFLNKIKKQYQVKQDTSDLELLLRELEAKKQQRGELQQPVQEEEKGFLQKAGNFVKDVGKDIAKPFARLGTTGYNLVTSAGDLTAAGVNKLMGEDEKASEYFYRAGEEAEKSRNLPFLGEVKPITKPKEAIGTGLEIGATTFGGGLASGITKGTVRGAGSSLFKQGVKTGLKNLATEGAVTGAAEGLGRGLSDDKSIAQSLKQGVIGAGIGAVAAPVLGGAAEGAGFLTRKGVDDVRSGLSQAKEMVGEGTERATKLLTGGTDDEVVEEAINKGIKPYFGNKTTPKARDTYYEKAKRAFHIISDEKPKITNSEGIVDSFVPENRLQMLEALNKSKSSIYNKYSSITQGKVGFDPSDTLKILDNTVNSKAASPEVRKYLMKQRSAIEELKGVDLPIVEERIRDLNSTLDGFFAGRVDRAKARVDASMANSLNNDLEKAIGSLTGEKYRSLRRDYSALKAVEKDLTRQVALEMRKNKAGLLDFTDIFTGSDIISGVLSANPSVLVKGLAGRSIKGLYGYLNDPNRYIKNAFKRLYSKENIIPTAAITKPANSLVNLNKK